MVFQAPPVRTSDGNRPLSRAERYFERALHFFQNDDFENALPDMEQAIHFDRYNGEFYATRGLILTLLKRASDAQKDFHKALELDPRQWVVYYGLGMLEFQARHYEIAIQHFLMAKNFVPLRPELFIYSAAAYYHRNNFEQALVEIDSALQVLNPDNPLTKEARKWQREIKKKIKAKKK